MKKITMMMILAAMVIGGGAFAGDLQDAQMAATAAITTNGATGTLGAVGEIKLMQIDVSNGNPVTIAITDQVTGATIYSAATAADTTLIPRLAVTGSGGAAITALSAAGVTNAVYAPVSCMGLNVAITSSSNTAQTVAIKVVTDKNP